MDDMTASQVAGAQAPLGEGVGGGVDVDRLYRDHGHWLVAFLRRRFGREVAEDLAQEAFVRTVGARTDIRNPRAFLARLAIRAASDEARRGAARLPVCRDSEADAPVLPGQLEAVLLEQLLRELPPKVREVYLLSRMAGLTYEEIAQRCGISVKRVEARMTQAHGRFAVLMRDEVAVGHE